MLLDVNCCMGYFIVFSTSGVRFFSCPILLSISLLWSIRQFLWAGQCESRVWAPIAWEVISHPKVNGGWGSKRFWHGIKLLYMLRLVHDITTNGPSLWVKWVCHYQLRHTTGMCRWSNRTLLEKITATTWWGAVVGACWVHGGCAWFYWTGLGEEWLYYVVFCVNSGPMECCGLAPFFDIEDPIYHVVDGSREAADAWSSVLFLTWDCYIISVVCANKPLNLTSIFSFTTLIRCKCCGKCGGSCCYLWLRIALLLGLHFCGCPP